MVDKALFSHTTDDWGTPQDLFDRINSVYRLEIDAAADETNHLLDKWFGRNGLEEDALNCEWLDYGTNFFLNPPYSLNKFFMKKVIDEYRKGANIIVLVPSRTDTRWWHEYVDGIAKPQFIRGRLKFKGATNSAPFPSVLLHYIH